VPAARILPIALSLLTFALGEPAIAAELALPTVVTKQIARDYAGAKVLRRRELGSLCADAPAEAGGVLRTDFDGDGNEDYAVLLNLGRSREKGEPGETLYDVALVAFMAEKGGAFRKIELDRFEGFALAFWLREEPEGDVPVEQRRTIVTIRNPGVYVDYCGGGGAVHYWQGGKFNAVEMGG